MWSELIIYTYTKILLDESMVDYCGNVVGVEHWERGLDFWAAFADVVGRRQGGGGGCRKMRIYWALARMQVKLQVWSLFQTSEVQQCGVFFILVVDEFCINKIYFQLDYY